MSLLDLDGEDGGMSDTFFPGSSDELGFLEEEIEDDEGSNDNCDPKYVHKILRVVQGPYIYSVFSFCLVSWLVRVVLHRHLRSTST